MKLYKPVLRSITLTGSAQRILVPAPGDTFDSRFVSWAKITAHKDNSNPCYVGDSAVTANLYSSSLSANDEASIGGPEYGALGGAAHGKVDLAKHYLLGSVGEIALLTVYMPDEG
jgi:hypothetical protein